MLLKLDVPTNIDNTIINMIKTDVDIDLQQEKEYINNLEEWQKTLIYSYLEYFGKYEESKNCLEYHEFDWFENCNTLEELGFAYFRDTAQDKTDYYKEIYFSKGFEDFKQEMINYGNDLVEFDNIVKIGNDTIVFYR